MKHADRHHAKARLEQDFEIQVQARRDLVFVAMGVTLEPDQEQPMTLQLRFRNMGDSLIDHVMIT